MSVMTKGFVAMAFWLLLGLGFTEMASLALDAWLLHTPVDQPADPVSVIQAVPHD